MVDMWNNLSEGFDSVEASARVCSMYGEFLDTEWLEPWPDPPPPVPEPHTLDPWRCHAGPDVILVPRELVERLVQPDRMREIADDVEDLEELAESIESVGLQNPLRLVVDQNGKICVRNGHHRIIVTRRWEHFEWLPLRIERSDGIRVNRAVRVSDVILELLLRSAPVPQTESPAGLPRSR